MRYFHFILLLSSVLSCKASTNYHESYFKVNDSIFPERIFLTATDNPGKSMMVQWSIKSSELKQEIQWTLNTPGPIDKEKVLQATANIKDLHSGNHFYNFQMENLNENTSYLYRVGTSGNWSAWYEFKTCATDQTIQFIYLGDTQRSWTGSWPRVLQAAINAMPFPDFILHAGDIVQNPDDDAEWSAFSKTASPVHSRIPLITVPGNHEYVKDENGKKSGITRQWSRHFSFPANGLEDLTDRNYFIDYSNLKIILMDSNTKLKEQGDWLDSLLEQNTTRWVIVIFHHPVYSAAKDRFNEGVQKWWLPVLEKHNVDLVLQGHDHIYSRKKSVNESATAGPVYITSVSGEKMYPPGDQDKFDVLIADTQCYQTIEIENDKLEYRAFSADGKQIDQFTIEKSGVKVIHDIR